MDFIVTVRSGGKTGQTYYKNEIENSKTRSKEEQCGDVEGRTVYETLFVAVEQALKIIPENTNVLIYSNNQAFIQGIRNNQGSSISGIQTHHVEFEYKKLEKIKCEGIMNLKIDVIDDRQFDFQSPEEMSHERQINLECAKSIFNFYKVKEHIYSDYYKLRTFGTDAWSSVGSSGFQKHCYSKYQQVCKYITDPVQQVYAMRWYQRGLTLSDAIRKVLIDQQNNNVIEKPKEQYQQMSMFDFLNTSGK